MITTVTLNPAIDKTIEIDDFTVGKVNRVLSMRKDAGGKGINVSKVIKSLGGKSRAAAVLAGENGKYISNYLNSSEIESCTVFIEGETRINTKVVDRLKHTNTDINEIGPLVSEKDIENLGRLIFSEASEKSVFVFSGSVPKNINRSIYKQWIEEAKSKGAKTILDADGELLKEGIKAVPYLVKPNKHELEELFGQSINSYADAVAMAGKLLENGIEIVVVSLGEEGALFVKKDAAVLAEGLKVEVISTVGAGDSMVAALAIAIDEAYDFESAVRLSMACGAASVMMSGSQAASLELINELKERVVFRYI